MINTYNESKLHKTLKLIYASKYDGECEICMDGKIFDVVAKDGTIIEIQTKNLASLLSKILNTLQSGKKVILVHPLVINKWIITLNENGQAITKRKSPRKGSIYSLFRELTGLYPALLMENFTLEVLETDINEIRIKTSEPVQSANGRRRYKKDWLKSDKELKEILCERIFKTRKDYLSLIPKSCPEEFSVKDLSISLKNESSLPASARENAGLMTWVLLHMGLIEVSKTEGRKKFYKIV